MSDQYWERTYRRQVEPDLAIFLAQVAETDLQIGAERPLAAEAAAEIHRCREPLERYVAAHPGFLAALAPWECGPEAPPIVARMCEAGRLAGVGPMAAVAGAIAECVGRGLLAYTQEVIVENGGDIFLVSRRPRRIRIFAGRSPLSDRMAVVLPATAGLGVCTSSGTVGPSLSFGQADAATVISENAALADAAATALGNRVHSAADLEPALEAVSSIEGVLGALAIVGDRLGAWGQVELEPLQA